MNLKSKMVELKKHGFRNEEIAAQLGVSRSYVYEMCGKNGKRCFKPITEKQCVYPIWREWFNENRVNRMDFIRMLEDDGHSLSHVHLSELMKGNRFPNKKNIDAILEVTGLTYEELFYREGDFD
jgi:transcriptional regulator with XRE-family HTH domain